VATAKAVAVSTGESARAWWGEQGEREGGGGECEAENERAWWREQGGGDGGGGERGGIKGGSESEGEGVVGRTRRARRRWR
jgi:hypothetical protein